jgi:hypothetical protein
LEDMRICGGEDGREIVGKMKENSEEDEGK